MAGADGSVPRGGSDPIKDIWDTLEPLDPSSPGGSILPTSQDAPVGGEEPPTPEVARPDTDRAVLDRLDQLVDSIGQLRQQFDRRILVNESEGRINAQLHAELQEHKNDLYAKLVKPILSDVARVREHVLKIAADRGRDGNQEASLELFGSFADDLAQILEENDVAIQRSALGDPFDSHRHQVVAKVPTEDPAAHRTIAASVGDSYIYRGHTLSRQRVTIHTHEPQQAGDLP